MLREKILREWNGFKSRLLSRWEKRRGLLGLRSWIVRELFYPQSSSQVSNEQIAATIRSLTNNSGLEYVEGMTSEEEE